MTRTAAVRFAVEPSAVVIAAADRSATPLNPEQRERHERLRQQQDRDDFVAARLLTQQLVTEATGQPADEVAFTQRCDHCGGPHGRALTDSPGQPHVSWSHATGWVAAVVGPRPCGIDVEPITDRPPVFDVLTTGEQDDVRSASEGRPQAVAFLRLWVRKEALLKAAGTGLTDQAALAQLDVRDDQLTYAGHSWQLTDLTTPDDVRAAIAVRS